MCVLYIFLPYKKRGLMSPRKGQKGGSVSPRKGQKGSLCIRANTPLAHKGLN